RVHLAGAVPDGGGVAFGRVGHLRAGRDAVLPGVAPVPERGEPGGGGADARPGGGADGAAVAARDRARRERGPGRDLPASDGGAARGSVSIGGGVRGRSGGVGPARADPVDQARARADAVADVPAASGRGGGRAAGGGRGGGGVRERVQMVAG